ncbi:uncharacterized protein MELLADRAFT_84635 [Melampsora larici-populina 98AG31]|uniref:Uncharacterized protein n=1 Tax=Melampsora larici-populina (strain 98AG31 / pathotype 3-4-7) TaxID=747676 RepID=F4RFZ3_MELLP|nr:uncharacterized protein MELLADRAFT_84635 [Melampsora larici-populina 98AG31]EGG08677.1 hypothetical protein MELLADRAFT_84635 [Melampsora larici-populina 98AG31]
MERIWSKFNPLVRQLRYVTKQHWLNALNFASLHKNDVGRRNAVRNALQHLQKTQKMAAESKVKLEKIRLDHGLDGAYLESQWKRKKDLQKRAMSSTSAEYLKYLAELVEFEEKLIAAQERLETLQQKKKGGLARKKKNALINLPDTMVKLEEAIEKVTANLGSVEFHEITGLKSGKGVHKDERAKALAKILVAKGRLVEAKSGVLEHRRRAGTVQGEV